MSCQDKLTNLTLHTTNSKEVDYEGNLGTNTKITEPCVNQEEVNEDLYSLVDETIEKLDTSSLGNSSITFPLTEGEIKFEDVIKQYETEISTLKAKVTNLENKDYCNIDITGCGIDFGTLLDPCSGPITTLGQLLNTLVSKHNS